MNCKPGELARIVRTAHFNIRPEFQNCIVECEDVCPAHSLLLGTAVWHVKPLSHAMLAAGIDHVPDECLRPLRDGPGDDESLSWAPRPEQLEALT